jgi:hypothetical protein
MRRHRFPLLLGTLVMGLAAGPRGIDRAAAAESGQPAPQAKPTDTIAGARSPNAPFALNSAEQAQIVKAVAGEDTRAKLPEGFTPQVGAKVPAKNLPMHPLPQALEQNLPKLKRYEYAQTEDTVLIINPMKRAVVAVIPR